jgi:K+-sensing histidine kinase KdpD
MAPACFEFLPAVNAVNSHQPSPAGGYLLAVAVSTLAALVAAAAERWLGLSDLSLVFMLAVVLVATRSSTGPALVTALLCFLAYNFFFIEPRFTLYIHARHGVATVLLFLAAALLAGRLASKLAMQVQALRDAHDQVLAREAQAQRLAADLQAERVASETERLRSALLSSVSHDLRTPLAAIIGAAGSLDSYGEAMDAQDRHALLETVRSEGERLDRYIQNLLDMTRLGHGTLALNRDWIGADELIGSAVGRLRRYQPGTRFAVSVDPGIGPIWVHPALVEQALFNVIENAAKFSPDDEAVAIDARRVGDRLRIDVVDRGPGIPEGERARIFDMFYSAARGDRNRDGTGLGLAICRGMVGAHGGEVEAFPGPDGRGTTLRISLPFLEPAPGTTR